MTFNTARKCSRCGYDSARVRVRKGIFLRANNPQKDAFSLGSLFIIDRIAISVE